MAGKSINTDKSARKNSAFGFFKGIKADIKRITWPTKEDTKKACIAVAVVTALYVVMVGGFDYIFQNLFEAILKLK